jgi:flagellar basal body-associated protein FliL
MHRRAFAAGIFTALATVCLIPRFASASEAKKGGKGGEDDAQLSQQVELVPVAIPISYRDALVNYVYVRIRVHLFRPTDAPIIHVKEPYIRDRLVRTAAKTSFAVTGDLNRINSAAMEHMLFQTIEAMVGRGVVQRVEIYEQTPQKEQSRPAV